MIRKKVGKIFSSKVFYITFSILFSILLWMYVEISQNQLREITVTGVQIVRDNEEILGDRGLLVATMNPESLAFTFECPRSIANLLTSASVSVLIDLQGITARGNSLQPYDIVFPPDIDESLINIVSSSVSRISLYIDRLDTRQVDVEVSYRGGTAEGFIQDPIEFSPQSIMVSGPAEAVSQVRAARVNIIRENLTSTYTDDFTFTLLDENGVELDESLLDRITMISDETIHVTVPIRVTKEVVLTVDISPGSGATAENTSITIDPPSVMIAGDPDDIRDYNSINLGTIDLTSFEQSRPFVYSIVIPNHFTNLSGETEADVLVEIHGLEIRYLSVTNIQTLNEPAGYTPEIRTQSIDVRIRGKAEDMVNLTEAHIRVVANLADANFGPQRVPARIHVDGIDADIGAVGAAPLITVTLYRDS